jgi:hypothetical protein
MTGVNSSTGDILDSFVAEGRICLPGIFFYLRHDSRSAHGQCLARGRPLRQRRIHSSSRLAPVLVGQPQHARRRCRHWKKQIPFRPGVPAAVRLFEMINAAPAASVNAFSASGEAAVA